MLSEISPLRILAAGGCISGPALIGGITVGYPMGMILGALVGLVVMGYMLLTKRPR